MGAVHKTAPFDAVRERAPRGRRRSKAAGGSGPRWRAAGRWWCGRGRRSQQRARGAIRCARQGGGRWQRAARFCAALMAALPGAPGRRSCLRCWQSRGGGHAAHRRERHRQRPARSLHGCSLAEPGHRVGRVPRVWRFGRLHGRRRESGRWRFGDVSGRWVAGGDGGCHLWSMARPMGGVRVRPAMGWGG